MLSNEILRELIDIRALTLKRAAGENLVFNVNYKILDEHHPDLIDFFIGQELSPDVYRSYEEGKIAYVILQDGTLHWKPTIKGLRML